MPTKLTLTGSYRGIDLGVKEIAFVDKGAGRGVHVALTKRNREENMPHPLAESIKKHLTHSVVNATMTYLYKQRHPEEVQRISKEGIDIGAKLDEILSKLSDEERTIVEMALAAAQGNATPPPAPAPEPMPEGGDEMAKRLVEIEKRAHEKDAQILDLTKRLGEEASIRKRRELIDMAKKFQYLPGEERVVVDILQKNYDDQAFMTWIGEVNARLESADILKARGDRGGVPLEIRGALGEVEAIAKKLQEADPKLSYEKAFDKALSDNPKLYNQLDPAQAR